MDDLIKCINVMKGSNAVELSEDDIERAVSKLVVLKGGFKMLSNGSQKHVLSVPVELNQDHSEILKLVKDQGGWVTPNLIANKLQWKQLRIVKALEDLQREGMFGLIDRWSRNEKPRRTVLYSIHSVIEG